jgi:hypothetical protein
MLTPEFRSAVKAVLGVLVAVVILVLAVKGAHSGPRKVPLPAWRQPPPCHQAPCKR